MNIPMKWGCGVSDDPQVFAAFMAAAPEREVLRAMDCLYSLTGKTESPHVATVFNDALGHWASRFGSEWGPW